MTQLPEKHLILIIVSVLAMMTVELCAKGGGGGGKTIGGQVDPSAAAREVESVDTSAKTVTVKKGPTYKVDRLAFISLDGMRITLEQLKPGMWVFVAAKTGIGTTDLVATSITAMSEKPKSKSKSEGGGKGGSGGGGSKGGGGKSK